MEDIELQAMQYKQLLVLLTADRISEEECLQVDYLNDLLTIPQSIQS
jgi:hypothetical protein